MDKGNLFYRGEDIVLTVSPDEDGVFTTSTPSALLIYPDGLDKSADGAVNQITQMERSVQENITVFTIPLADTYSMPLGDYTAELIFGSESDRTIVVIRSAFTLKRSGQELKQVTPTINGSTD